MAKIVGGFGTSHGPQLKVAPPEEWIERGRADRQNTALWYRGKTYDFEGLKAAREDFTREITPEVTRGRWDRMQASLDALHTYAESQEYDALVIVSSDHKEIFGDELLAPFAIYWGDSVEHLPFGDEDLAAMSPGLAKAALGDVPDRPVSRPVDADLARHLINAILDEGFDPAASKFLPAGRYKNGGIPHGWGFIYQRILGQESTIPMVPIFVNTFWQPTPPSAARSYDFGVALGKAIESYPADIRVGIVASGGLSHFVVDEELDRAFIKAFTDRDVDYLRSIPAELMTAGTSELRNWITVAGAAHAAGLEVDEVRYEPAYRTEAGTGNAMGFVTWKA
jgi:Catalytic LigB subunit of aromatic ring-opening dioxygenase.